MSGKTPGASKAGGEESMPDEEGESNGCLVPPPPPPGPPPPEAADVAGDDAYADAMLVSEEPQAMSLSGPGVSAARATGHALGAQLTMQQQKKVA